MTTTPEGWYADPQTPGVPGAERWWNGFSWTAHTRVAPSVAPTGPVPPVPPPAPVPATAYPLRLPAGGDLTDGVSAALNSLWDQVTKRPVLRQTTTSDGVPLASVGQRGLAFVVDLVIVLVAAGIARGLLVGIPFAVLGRSVALDQLRHVVDVVVTLAVAFGYHAVSLRSAHAATPGKRIMAVQVRSVDGRPLSSGQVARRALLSSLGVVAGALASVPYVGAAGLLKVLWPLVDGGATLGSPTLQALHDRWAGTQVVRR